MSMQNNKPIIIEKTGYGYEATNPVKVFTILGVNQFFDNIKYDKGEVIHCHRLGSKHPINYPHIVDRWEILTFNNEEKVLYIYTIYIDMYEKTKDITYPQDFSMKK